MGAVISFKVESCGIWNETDYDARTSQSRGNRCAFFTGKADEVASRFRCVRILLSASVVAIASAFLGGNAYGSMASTSDVLYASNWPTGVIDKISPGGVIAPFATVPGAAEGITSDANGNLYVAVQPNQIDKITPAGVVSTYATGLSGTVYGITFGTGGNLYVACQTSSFAGAVDEVTPAGVASTVVNGFPGSPHNPEGIAVDGSGDLFVADYDQNSILEVMPNGATSTFASGLNEPVGLVFDRVGNLYVAAGGSIEEFSPSGAASRFAVVPTGTNGLAFDSEGDLFVASGLKSMSEILPNGAVSSYATGFSSDVVYVTDPAAVAVPEPTGSLWLCATWTLTRRTRRLREMKRARGMERGRV